VLQCAEGASRAIHVSSPSFRRRVKILIFYCSKWFLQALGLQGLNNMLAGFPDKSAQAVGTFAYCEGPGHEPIIFQGRTDVSFLPLILIFAPSNGFQGKIVPPRGPPNFGNFSRPLVLLFPLIFYRLGSNIRGQRHNVSTNPKIALSLVADCHRYAEMEKVEKNKISHRFRALEKLKAWLLEG
jgi:inosine triphosphate pyrophosphatase